MRLTYVNREDMMLICMARHRHLASRSGGSPDRFYCLGFTRSSRSKREILLYRGRGIIIKERYLLACRRPFA